MAEILHPEVLLTKIARYAPLARIFLATPGTLQGTLSAYFGTPIGIEVRHQEHRADGSLHRVADLVRRDHGTAVVHATTTLEVEREDARELVLANQHGIGQILVMLGIHSTFELLRVGEDDACIWREYRLGGEGVRYLIREEFPRSAFSSISV